MFSVQYLGPTERVLSTIQMTSWLQNSTGMLARQLIETSDVVGMSAQLGKAQHDQ
jgi:hypothetical protein